MDRYSQLGKKIFGLTEFFLRFFFFRTIHFEGLFEGRKKETVIIALFSVFLGVVPPLPPLPEVT